MTILPRHITGYQTPFCHWRQGHYWWGPEVEKKNWIWAGGSEDKLNPQGQTATCICLLLPPTLKNDTGDLQKLLSFAMDLYTQDSEKLKRIPQEEKLWAQAHLVPTHWASRLWAPADPHQHISLWLHSQLTNFMQISLSGRHLAPWRLGNLGTCGPTWLCCHITKFPQESYC